MSMLTGWAYAIGQTNGAIKSADAIGVVGQSPAVNRNSGPSPNLFGWLSMEAANIRRLANDVAVHRLHQILTSGGGRQIQLRVQGIELEHVVMEWSRTCARPEKHSICPASDARAVHRSIRQSPCAESFR